MLAPAPAMPTCSVPPSSPMARLPTTTPTRISTSATDIPVRIEIKLASNASPIQTAAMNQMFSSIKKLLPCSKESLARAVFPRSRERRQTPLPVPNFTVPLVQIKQSSTDSVPILLSFVIRISSFPSHLEAFAEIKLTADGIVDQEVFCAFALDAAIVNQIRAVHD